MIESFLGFIIVDGRTIAAVLEVRVWSELEK